MANTYTREEATAETLKYFNGDELATSITVDKYLLSDDGTYYESNPDQKHRRLAREFARIESKYTNPLSEDEIYLLLKDYRYVIPQGSPMAGIGNPFQVVSLSNCFTVPNCYDAYSGIMYTDQEIVQIEKRRGGVGTDVSNIRPKNMKVKNAAKTTDGIEIFMQRFSNSTREVAQNGRRGALMLTCSCHHPEILTFIRSKKNLDKITGANISVRWTDEFMNAVKNDTEVQLRWPVDSREPVISEYVKARDVWKEFIHCSWASAEPGSLFWSTILRDSPSDCYEEFRTVCTNPCSEIPMGAYASCKLLLVNVCSFVVNPFTPHAYFDWKLFHEVTYKAQKLMDDIVDLEAEAIDKIIEKVESDPEPDYVKQTELNLWKNIKRVCLQERRTGLGPTAIGDTLAMLGITYGSTESIKITGEIYKALATASYESSVDMARDRGPFPAFKLELERDHHFIKRITEQNESLREKYLTYGRRNIANTTTAPAGSTSNIALLSQEKRLFGTTSGIEPAIFLSYTRRKKVVSSHSKVDFIDETGDKWEEFEVFHNGFKLWQEINKDKPKEQSPYYKATSGDVNWLASVELQAEAQKWICHAISKTCNLPSSASEELVNEIYLKAWEMGCKGFTIYRDGCRSGVLVQKDKTTTQTTLKAPKRPAELLCDVRQVTVNKSPWIVFVGLMDGVPYEVFAGPAQHVEVPKKVKNGKIVKTRGGSNARYNFVYEIKGEEITVEDIGNVFLNPTEAAFNRLISLNLRHKTPIQFIKEQLSKAGDTENDLYSLSKAMSRVFSNYITDGTFTTQKECTSCNSTNLSYQEGCVKCLDCGFSKCG